MSDNAFLSTEEIVLSKTARRHSLAALPVEEKIGILIKLQELATAVKHQTGRNYQRPWNIKVGTTLQKKIAD
jgi:hypothetical protein